jgi:hypothetical protein
MFSYLISKVFLIWFCDAYSLWSSFICAQLLRSVVVTICHFRFSSLEVPKYSCGTLEELLCDHGTQKTTCYASLVVCSGLETVHIFACKFLRCWIIWNDMSSCPIDSKGSKYPNSFIVFSVLYILLQILSLCMHERIVLTTKQSIFERSIILTQPGIILNPKFCWLYRHACWLNPAAVGKYHR